MIKKNYEKMYKRLVKEIKRMKKDQYNGNSMEHDPILKEVEKRENQFAVTTMNCILEMHEEISSIKWNNAIMNQFDFRKWKKEMTI